MPTTQKYRLLLGSHSRIEDEGTRVTYKSRTPGRDILSLTRQEAKAMGDRVKPLGTFDTEVPEEREDDQNVSTDYDTLLSEMTATDAVKMISQLESLDELDAAREAEERKSSPRKGVLKAIEDRTEDLTQG